MPVLILTAALLQPVEVREVEVSLLESNEVVREDGSVRLRQCIVWDHGRDEHDRECVVNRGYLVQHGGEPSVHRYGDGWRVIRWCGPDRCVVVTAPEHQATTTREDLESKWRTCGGDFRPCW